MLQPSVQITRRLLDLAASRFDDAAKRGKRKTKSRGARSASPSFLPSVATVFGGQIASAMIALLIEVVCARLLGPEGRGQIALCMMIIALGTMLGGLGGEIPITIWAAKAREEFGAWIPAVMFWGLLGATAAVAVWFWGCFDFGDLRFLRELRRRWPSLWRPRFRRASSLTIRSRYSQGLSGFVCELAFRSRRKRLNWWPSRCSRSCSVERPLRQCSEVLVGFVIGGIATIPALRSSAAGRWNFRQAREKLLPALNLVCARAARGSGYVLQLPARCFRRELFPGPGERWHLRDRRSGLRGVCGKSRRPRQWRCFLAPRGLPNQEPRNLRVRCPGTCC